MNNKAIKYMLTAATAVMFACGVAIEDVNAAAIVPQSEAEDSAVATTAPVRSAEEILATVTKLEQEIKTPWKRSCFLAEEELTLCWYEACNLLEKMDFCNSNVNLRFMKVSVSLFVC